MFITKAELKLYFNKSAVACAVIIALLSIAAGLLGDKLIYAEKLIPEFKLYIVDNDKSLESAMLLEALSSFKTDTMTVITGVSVSEAGARSAVADGIAAAALIIPEGFFADIMSGVNTGAQLVLNGQNEAVSELIVLFAESIKEQLSASQSGIYYVLSKASDYETYIQFMNEANIVFLSLFMGRSIVSETVAPFGALSNTDYYMFSFYIFIMFIFPCLLIENGGKLKGGSVFALLISKRSGLTALFVYKLLAVLIFFAALNGFFAFLMAYAGVLSGIGAFGVFALFLLLTLIQSSFCYMFLWLFNDIRTASICIFVLELAALFFSGGILPINFLPNAIRRFSKLTPNFHLSSLFASLKAGKFDTGSIVFIAAFIAFNITVSYAAAYAKARSERLI